MYKKASSYLFKTGWKSYFLQDNFAGWNYVEIAPQSRRELVDGLYFITFPSWIITNSCITAPKVQS